MQNFYKLIEYWQGQKGLYTNPPLGLDSISEFEQANSVLLPDDLREYLQTSNGFNLEHGQGMDKKGFRLWPLSDFQAVTAFENGQFRFDHSGDFFVFADYMDFSWGYCMGLKRNPLTQGKTLMIGTVDGAPIKVADSFTEFVSLYLDDSYLLYKTQ